MNAAIGVYDSHEKAIEAVRQLKARGYPIKQLSIIGKAEIEEVVDSDLHVQPKNPISLTGVGIGTTLGATLGVLTGVGLFAIPGLGFLYGAGAVVGAIAGIDFGLIGGGIASVFATVGLKDEDAKKYQENLAEGKFIVVAHGDKDEVSRALSLLETHGSHSHAAAH